MKKENIIFPPLPINLGLMKQFIKALKHDKAELLYLRKKFPKISDTKAKDGIFMELLIHELMHGNKFQAMINEIELATWCAFKGVRGLLKKQNQTHYDALVDELMKSYQHPSCDASLKLNFLHTHLSFFLENA